MPRAVAATGSVTLVVPPELDDQVHTCGLPWVWWRLPRLGS